ncbi:hypothetical protein SAMN05892883_1512 [Jatrophihabitans sp. GAS493]|nr:hypothetical protein SAMN05892883_1512 [Jatrophihabitans sp. GAS493]
MLTLVYEEAPFWEIGSPVTEYLGGDQTFVEGPWSIESCSAVLLRWFDAGWLHCIAVARSHTIRKPAEIHRYTYDADWQSRATLNKDYWVLQRSDARALVADPARWSTGGPDAGVCLCRTDATDSMTFAEWAAAVSDIIADPTAP